jgi:hypothetical protein
MAPTRRASRRSCPSLRDRVPPTRKVRLRLVSAADGTPRRVHRRTKHPASRGSRIQPGPGDSDEFRSADLRATSRAGFVDARARRSAWSAPALQGVSGRSRGAAGRASPRCAPGDALRIKPGRLILRDAGWKDLCLPCVCRRFKPLQGGKRRGQCIRSLQSRFLRHLLPCKQESEEISRSDRLDLGAQALDRIMVDAGKQSAVAPLVVIDSCRSAQAVSWSRGVWPEGV